MLKRIFDVVISAIALVVSSPFLLIGMLAVWLQDGHSPFYTAHRVGKNGKMFKMIKLRSMVVDADKANIQSVATTDTRVTKVGKFIREFKLDELSQFWNVLKGDMSFVGPRPNVIEEVDRYTIQEQRLLSVLPGVTDFASIVFSDLGEILVDSEDSNLAYNQLVRPWKSRLGLFYIDHASMAVDIKIMFLTANAIISKKSALRRLSSLLESLGAPENYIRVASRKDPLVPTPPPGADSVVTFTEGEQA